MTDVRETQKNVAGTSTGVSRDGGEKFMRHPCWPTKSEERLLRACFASKENAREKVEEWRAGAPSFDSTSRDSTSRRFLPLLYHRWKGQYLDEETAALSQRVYLSVWRQNQDQLRTAFAIQEDLRSAGIECILLKGAALLARYYRTAGLRGMGDVDVLVRDENARPALETLLGAGWNAENEATVASILRQARVRHAWQLSRDGEECDLHWRPIVRCYAPEVTEHFWNHAQTAEWHGVQVKVPSPTDQLFHVCVHGMQWDWNPKIQWVADALIIIEESPIDWDELWKLAAAAQMTYRLRSTLEYLRNQMGANIPLCPPDEVSADWEKREHKLLQKACPLGLIDSASWHWTNFRRIRKFDSEWSHKAKYAGFAEYLTTFLDARGAGDAVRGLRAEVGKRIDLLARQWDRFRWRSGAGKTCLVVIFNHAYAQNIAKLRRIYAGRFSDIVFLLPNVRVDDAACFTGYRGSNSHHGLIADAREFLLARGADSYIFCADDAILNPALTEDTVAAALRLGDHDAFLPVFGFLGGRRAVGTHDITAAESWSWTRRVVSRLSTQDIVFGSGAEGCFSELPDVETAIRKFERYGVPSLRIEFDQSPGYGLGCVHELPLPMAYGYADMFAVRRHCLRDFAHYLGIFASLDIFVEVAIPTALILATESVVTAKEAGWDFWWFSGPQFKTVADFQEKFDSTHLFKHPVKLSGMTV